MFTDLLPWIQKKYGAVSGMRRWSRRLHGPRCPASEARALLGARDQRFLYLMKNAVYGHSSGPYLKLLKHAGCEYGDLEVLTHSAGMDKALYTLSEKGVFITHNEMKGREPVVRGSARFDFASSDFDNPLIAPQLGYKTSGSTGKAAIVGVSYQHLQNQILHTALSAGFHRVENAAVGIWLPRTEWSISRSMRFYQLKMTPARWFSQMPVFPNRSHIAYGLSTAGIIFLSRLFGMRLPFLKYQPLSDPGPVVRWMRSELRRVRRVFMVTYPSTASRACTLALRSGISLKGALLLIAGESVTSAKRKVIEDSGAEALPLFGSTETGEAAEGCLAPNDADDMHLYMHRFAVISRDNLFETDSRSGVLQFTTLDPATPKIFLNADMGDAGIVEKRTCGCPWGEMGFNQHIRNIWSYAKLSAEGMTLPGDVIFNLLEHRLPGKFGGHAGDYQLLSEPKTDGVTRYLLCVDLSLGDVDEPGIRQEFLRCLASGGAGSRFVAEYMNRSDQLNVVRRRSDVQAGGKSLPVVFKRV